MITRSVYVLVVIIWLATITGCESITATFCPIDPKQPCELAKRELAKRELAERELAKLREWVKRELAKCELEKPGKCKELVESHNAPLIIAVRVAITKATGTPVEAMETSKSGQTVYRVLIQGQAGMPKTIDVSQHEVDGGMITDPSSAADCHALDESKVEKIITAMRLARNNVPGRLVKAKFTKYEGNFVYSVTIQDSAGKSHEVQVDADHMIILNPTGVGH